jgi:Ca2+/Na+ antiporter
MWIKLRIFFLFAYILSFFILVFTGELKILNGLYFPVTILALAILILIYKVKVKRQEERTKGTDRLKDELFNVEIFTAVVVMLFSLFKIIEYVISLCNAS